MIQNEALDLLKLGENVFLTGAAGSGKTWLLNAYIRHLRTHGVDVAVTASTGIAATHLNGKTIHSWSGMGVRDALTNADLDKLAKNRRIKANLESAKVLVIDEVSMLHPHQLDMVDQIARHLLDFTKPFGGLQVILCGDFFQLPPVSNARNGVPIQFAYESSAWTTGGFRVCYLQEQFRQGDDPLLTILNDIRGGMAGEHTKVPLRTRYKREPEGNVRATRLYAHNVNVDRINDEELAKLRGAEKTFRMESRGFAALVEGLKKSCLAPEVLKLKTGADVMFIRNAPDGAYVNGTRGVVEAFDNDGWPVVRTFDGETIVASPEEWKFEDNGEIRATISQVPLRLAWAITIHKSQGMTLDAAEIDLGKAFEPGMGYVALSRVRSLAGLKLMNLNEIALQVHPEILANDSTLKEQSRLAREHLRHLTDTERQRQQQDTLVKRFKGSLEEVPIKEPRERQKKEKKPPSHTVTLEMLRKKMPLDAIARERELKPGTIIDHIEKLKGAGDLPDITYLKDAFPANDFESVLGEFRNSEDGKLSPIRQKLGNKYSWDDLRLVRLFVN
ncbi:MAG TPA: helix-turn-helix domain-containing protein [Gammaproteobacteria bacterium]